MILRGDGSSNIQKGSSFDKPKKLYRDFEADKLLLNPPFSFKEKGMPFMKFGLDHMKIGGKAAIIIQDSAGSGKAVTSCKAILKTNQLIASIKMPVDLFQPMAGVQTSIYVIEHTGKKHDTKKQVKFIDFRNDGYKRTGRVVYELDNPDQRYNDIIEIYRNGLTANVSPELWDLQKQVVMENISLEGNDWNFDKHKIVDTTPTINDFKKTVSDYISWEVSNVLKLNTSLKIDNKPLNSYDFDSFELTNKEKQIFNKFIKAEIEFKEFEISSLFNVSPSKAYNLKDGDILVENGKTPYVSNQSQNNGCIGWSNLDPLNPSNVITLSDTWQSERTIYYQPYEFIGKSHLQVMKPLDSKFQQFDLFFVISSFRKAILEMKYNYGTKFNREKIKATKIQLPVINKEIDHSSMRNLISAVQKLVIRDVVKLIGSKINVDTETSHNKELLVD